MTAEPALDLFERAYVRALPLVAALGVAAEVSADRRAPSVAVEFLSLSYEQNLPTWYASGLLLLCARALADASRASHALRRGFVALAAVFTYLSLDEAVEIHEFASALYAGTGVLYFGWVVPAAIVVAVVGAAFVPFLRALPAPTRRAFVAAGAIYVGGALGMELPLGYYAERHGVDSLGYALIDAVEETLELVGAAYFLLAVRHHARDGVEHA